jgi:hypothetical protein
MAQFRAQIHAIDRRIATVISLMCTHASLWM